MKDTVKERAKLFEDGLQKLYPESQCGLEYGGDPYKLLVAAILSAQCTDRRVNATCILLFERWNSAEAMALAEVEDIAAMIRPVGLFNSKAKNISLCCRKLVNEYAGTVPSKMDELLSLPGVGRKIANLIRGDLYGLGGIVADTHMIRICHRLGFTKKPDPLETERVMSTLIAPDAQSELCHRAVMFGRDVCKARSPLCSECTLRSICLYDKITNI